VQDILQADDLPVTKPTVSEHWGRDYCNRFRENRK